ncbi:MAG: choice-of-anchor Q domain-containing protein [Chitinophagaceae bacterium]
MTCPIVSRVYVDSSIITSGNGSSWAQAYKTVWEALTIANACPAVNEIWIKKGIYYPMSAPDSVSSSRDSSFRILRNGIKIYGGFAGTETALAQRNIAANPSILSGDIGTINDSTDNSYHVVTIISPSGTTIDTTMTIDGLTITGANANGGTFILGTIATLYGSDGGGMLNIANGTGTQSNPLIQNCTFTRNTAGVGGGFYSRGASGISNPTFRYCTFFKNYASDVAGLHSYADGGGFSNPKVYNCLFKNNQSNLGAACGAYSWSGGSANPAYFSCVFESNTATNSGGAGYVYGGSITFTNSVFVNNSANTSGATGGGAIGISGGQTATLNNCTLYNNTTASTANPNSNAIMGYGTLNLNNTVIWGTAVNQLVNSGTSNFNYSDIEGVAAAGTNLNTDPLFVNAANPIGADNIWATADDGLELTPCSPALNTGSNALIPSGITTDIVGAARIQQTTVDMGAYEANGTGVRVYVDGSVASSGTGLSWASPYKTVTEALTFVNASPCINEVWVKAGTYYPTTATGVATTNRDSSFRIMRDGIKVYGGFVGTETATTQRNIAANPTILSGDIGTVNDSTDNVYHVFTILTPNGTGTIDTSTRLDGLIIRDGNGYAATGGFSTVGFGFNHQDGGGLYFGAYGTGVCNPQIVNCTLTHNGANFGAGVYVNAFTGAALRSNAIFTNCTFSNNHANNQGGGIFNNGNSYDITQTISNCKFTNNIANGNGAAVFSYNGRLNFLADTMSGNVSVNNGGAFYSQGDSLTISNCAFSNNTCTAQSGGAIYNSTSNGIVTNTSFTNDSAVNGGAINQSGGQWTYSNCNFSGNKSTTGVGGAVNQASDVTAYANCNFSNNIAATNGAAVYGNNDTLNVSNCVFSANVSNNPGQANTGALTSVGNSLLTVGSSNFLNNSGVGGFGGAISTNSYTNISLSAFSGNTALAGGAVAITGGGKAMTINRCSFIGNTGVSNAGALAGLFNAILTVQNSTFSQNSSPNYGGAFYSQNAGLSTFVADTFSNNWSNGGGGAMQHSGNPSAISNCVFSGNRANNIGGAINSSGQLTLTGSIFTNDTGSNGGAISMGSAPSFVANRNFFRANRSTGGSAGAVYTNSTNDTLVNNVFVDNKAVGSGGGGGLQLNMATGNQNLIANNTFYHDTVTSGNGGALQITGTGGILGMYNNISWQNQATANPDFYNASSGTAVVNQSNNYSTPDPKFLNAANPLGVDNLWGTADDGLSLSPCSPAINFGINPPILNYPTDAALAARIQQTTVDAGAYESALLNTSVTPSVTINVSPNDTVCFGTNVTFTGTPVFGGVAPQYQWVKNITNVGTSIPTYADAGLNNGDTVKVRLISNALCRTIDTVYSNVIRMEINPTPTITTTSHINPTACGGTNGVITLYGLAASTSYIFNFDLGGIAQGPITKTTTGSGSVTFNGLASGVYTNFTATLGACTSVPYSGPVTLSPPASPTITSATKTDPTACGGSNGTITLYGLNASTTYIIAYFDGTTTTTLTSQLSSGTGTITITGLPSGTYSNFAATLSGCTGTFAGPVTLNPPTAPAITSATKTDPTACGGSDGTITLHGLNVSTTYTIAYFDGTTTTTLTSQLSSGTGTITITGLPSGTYSNFAATLSGCTGTFAGPVTLSPPVSPSITSISKTDPTSCGGSDGTITLNGLNASVSYTISYFNGTTTITLTGQISSGSGTITLTGLGAGTYSTFSATRVGCTGTNATSITLNPPASPSITSASKTDPTTCGGTDGTITLNGLSNSATYTISYFNGSTTITFPGQTSNGTGSIILTGLPAGTYSAITATRAACSGTYAGTLTLNPPATPAAPTAGNNGPICSGGTLLLTASTVSGGTYSWTGPNSFNSLAQNPSKANAQMADSGLYSVTVTVAGCTSLPGTTNAIVNPTPVIGSITAISPTSCGGSNGSLSVNGLTPAANYTINFSKGSIPQSAFTAVANASGSVIIPGQGLGIYTAFTATLGSCTSASTGNVIISNPAPPATPSISSNSTRCAGDTLRLFTTVGSGVSYAWSGPNSFSATAQNPYIVNVQTNATGGYSLIVTDLGTGCSSSPATLSATVYPLPVITSSSSTNPLTCGGTTGTITINGLSATTSFTINYSRNGIAQTPVLTTSDGSGTVVLTGLNAGVYTNITASSNGCPSNAIATITISDPPIPPAPIASSNSPVCQGTTLNLNVTGQTGAIFSWTGPNTFTSASSAPSVTNMQAVNAGIYSVTQTVAGCVSSAGTTTVLMSIPPPTPGAIVGDTLPCVNSSYTYSIGAVPTATSYNWSLPTGWTGTSTTTSITATSNTTAGLISVTASNVCGTSAASTLNTTILAIPAQPGPIGGLASLCNGTYTSYTIANVSLATSYTWTMPTTWTGYNYVNNLTVTAGPNSGNITVTADNKCGSSPLRNLAVTVTSIPGQPGLISGSMTPCINSAQTYTTSAVSAATSYVWTYPVGWSGGSTTNTVNLTAGAISGNISVSASNVCGTGTSRTLAVVVTPLPQQPTTISGPTAPCVNSTVTYNTAGATDATSYNWAFPSGWNGSSATNSSSVLVGTVSGSVVVIGVNRCGSGPSQSFAVTTTPVDTPTASVSASSVMICKGSLDTFTAMTTNAGISPVYQWKKNGTNVGLNSATYVDLSLNDGDSITVTLTSSQPCLNQPNVASKAFVIKVNPIVVPGININSSPNITLCSGISQTFITNDTGAGSSPTYQWYKNGNPIVGATSPTYTDAGLATKDTIVIVMQSSALCAVPKSASSNKVGVTILPAVTPTVSISANPAGPYAVVTPVTFTATETGGGATPTYQWLKNGVNIAFATASTYTANLFENGDEYSVEMQSYDPCAKPTLATSNTISLQLGNTAVSGYGPISGEISLYPNPTTGRFTITAKWPSDMVGKRATIDVMNGLGQLVYHTVLQPDRRDWSYDISLGNQVADGDYMLRISGDGISGVLRFVVGR